MVKARGLCLLGVLVDKQAGISELIPKKQNTIAIILELEVHFQVLTVLLAA